MLGFKVFDTIPGLQKPFFNASVLDNSLKLRTCRKYVLRPEISGLLLHLQLVLATENEEWKRTTISGGPLLGAGGSIQDLVPARPAFYH